MKRNLFLSLMIFWQIYGQNAFAINYNQSPGTMFDARGLTITPGLSDVRVDTSRWSLNKSGNYSLFTPITNDSTLKDNEVYIAHNKKNLINGVKEVHSSFTRYLFNDLIVIVYPDGKGFSVSADYCRQLKSSYNDLNKCKEIILKMSQKDRTIEAKDREIFNDMPENTNEEKFIKDLSSSPYDALSLVMNTCDLLLNYAKEEVPSSPSNNPSVKSAKNL